ncbi:hypothetical protein K491DRAFT_700808 [Lophiostoma macrostomum CBS 122681]|uniref:Uncharacterized protein n=1 Tax=Lophiostoma macrostomum CBS 122681 TaxID=1314788 RepID=A0A6A6TR01_9PLEO|nr:hypothetical protein K491DRAFT_700808 [Lophiostoma macrostomum CBS 122681]
MDSERPHLSITLPRNFQFHYQDAQPPRTPEPEPQLEELQPPPPPRAALKVRRRRTTAVNAYHALEAFADDMPIPTIEAPQLHSDASTDLPTLPSALDSDYLSPVVTFSRMLSPPKTPVSQMRVRDFEDPQTWDDMDQASQSETSSRPTSSSGFSDSSVSSRGSLESFPSLGGSCTSPEEDMTDPFMFFSPETKYLQLTSPLAAHQLRPVKKLKLRATFNEEMDRHLWMTYMTYLQDPTVTPFKALPSTVPPNGVCHRVARMARKTWKGPRTPASFSIGRLGSQFTSRSGTPDTIKPIKSGSSTPVPGSSGSYARYPSEKQCRKRLRDLAKAKPSLSAHYHRLLHHRSPSPFQSIVFTIPSKAKELLDSRFEYLFGHQHCSLHAIWQPSFTIGKRRDAAIVRLRLVQRISSMVGSSFARMSEMTDVSINQHNSQTWHALSAHPPRLGSPLQLHAPRPISRPFKRRALHNFEEQARNRGDSFVDRLFGAPAESSHRRVRSRGFSLGDMMDGARRLPLSTTSPAEFNPFADRSDVMQPTEDSHGTPETAHGEAIVRLGSPFAGKPNNTFPRAATSYGFEPPASFEQRFAALPSDPAYLNCS